MVDPSGQLAVLAVEGLTRVDDPDDDYEAVDVAEYFGGEEFSSATRVVASQLKHSTRHYDLAWTTARLCEVRKRRKVLPGELTAPAPSRSLLLDLAGVYQRLLDVHGRDAVLDKLRVQLVSNRPVDESLEDAVASATAIIHTQPQRLQAAGLIKLLPTGDGAVIRTLWARLAGHLHSADFCDFLTVLDFSECGRAGRFKLEREVRTQLASLAPGRTDDATRALFHRVRAEALPDQSRTGLRRADVLASLGVADVRTLYPSPRRLAVIANPLPAPSAGPLAEAVLAAPGGTVIAHGPKGTGKTTALSQMDAHLPDGSLVVIYDCFGGGEYLNTGRERHVPHRFATQIINELALTCGTPLLLQPHDRDEDLWRRLGEAIGQAASALPPDARLVLAVDAADNAAYAAERADQDGFLPALQGLSQPQNATLVLTARSHRIAQLGSRAVTTVTLEGFDAPCSTAHLRRYFPNTSDADAQAFHTRTAGNPRAQFYVLERARDRGWDVGKLLEECRATPDELFKDLIDSALHVSGSGIGGVRWLAMLTALSRPVSIEALTAALHVDQAQADLFAAGLAPGVEIEGTAIKFRDEDFETFVRQQLSDQDLKSAHSDLADLFLATRHSDADAAEHVAEHLANADRLREVVQLVLDDQWPSAIRDGFQRLTAQGRRLDLALHGAQAHGDESRALQVVMRAVAASSSTRTLSILLGTHVELVARHGDPETVARQHLRHNADEWLGAAHMRASGILSRSAATCQAAVEQLGAADAWLRRRQSEPKSQTRGWRLDAQDVALAAEAYLRLEGVERVRDWLLGWISPEFRLEVVALLAARVAPEFTPDALRLDLESLRVPAAWHAPFLAFAELSLQVPDSDWVDRVTKALLRQPAGKPAVWKDRYCAVVVRHGDQQLAAQLLQHWTWPTVENSWSYQTAASEGILVLRQRALDTAVAGAEPDAASMLPPSLAKTSATQYSSQQSQWLQRTRPLLRLCALRAQMILGQASDADVTETVEHELAARTDAAGHRWFRGDGNYRAWAAMAAELILDMGGAISRIEELAEHAPNLLGDQAPWLWLDIASALTTRGVHLDDAAALCLRAADYSPQQLYSAGERLELLAECTVRADTASTVVGDMLFARTMEATESIDDAAAELLAVHARLAHRASSPVVASDAADLALTLVKAAEHAARFASEAGVVPYQEVLGAAARLHAQTGFATASRWDDEDRFPLADGLPPVMEAAVDSDFISVEDALCLEHLIEEPSARLRSTLALAEKIPAGAGRVVETRRVLRKTAGWLRRNARASEQPDLARHLLAWAKDHQIHDQQLHAQLDPVLVFEDRTDPAQHAGHWPTSEDPHVSALLADPGTCRVADLAADVEKLSDAFVGTDNLKRFILTVVQNAGPGDRLAALEAVASLPTRRRSQISIALDVLAECVERWRTWPGVSVWAATALPDLVEHYLPELDWHRPEATATTLRAFGLPDNELRTVLMTALRGQRPSMSTRQLQSLAALLAELAEPAVALDALTALLGQLPAASAMTVRHPTVTDTAAAATAGLLWSAFGHHRKAIRWRAAHSTRELLLLGNPALADMLVQRLSATTAGDFRDPSLHFYWLSARVWLLVALQRVAAEQPDALVGHRAAFIRVATDRTLPHIQIRELTRWTAQALSTGNTPADDAIDFANQAVSCHLRRGYANVGNERSAATTRYRFDSMDTLPYWYTHLAKTFDIPLTEVASRAERWIIDELGLGEDDWMGDARELRDERTAQRMSHRHGAIPPLEGLRLYLEYHAMMLTAGELVDAGTPVLVDSYDDPADPWREWLDPTISGSRHAWLADTRSPIPAEPMLFGDVPPIEEWPQVDPAEFEQILRLDAGQLPDVTLVAGHTTIFRPGGYGTVYVRSALVAPTNASDLQRALQASSNPQDWRLPDENDSELGFRQGPYELRGWLLEDPWWTRDSETLDKLDPYCEGLSWSCVLPGRDFRSRTACTADPTAMRLLDMHEQPTAWCDHWSDEEIGSSRRPHTIQSSGFRTFVKRTALCSYLATTGMQLIMKVQIGRQRDGGSRTEDYRTPTSRIFRVDEHGRVHSL